jgi:hypothetical protein
MKEETKDDIWAYGLVIVMISYLALTSIYLN